MPPRPLDRGPPPAHSHSDSPLISAPNAVSQPLSPSLSPISPSSPVSSIASLSRSPSPSPTAADRPHARSSSVYLQVPNHSSSPTSHSNDAATNSSSAATRLNDNFEMEPIAGHRRRRSSLMSPQAATGPAPGTAGASAAGVAQAGAGAGAGANAGGPGPSLQGQASGPRGDEPKIIEENGEDETGQLLRSAGGSRSSPSNAGDDSGDDSGFSSDEDLRDDEETGLTRKERRKRRMRRDRNQRLDQRLVNSKISAEEKKQADHNVAKSSAVNLTLILLWYFFSLMISIYNKWMFGEGRLNFAFPLFTTCFHMLVQFALASLVLYIFPSLRPQRPSNRGRSRHQPEVEKPLMSWFFYITRIGPCGAATGLDIGLGNMSLKFITLTFYTMCKSSALAFVLLFAFVFRLETPTWRLVGIIATMTIGVVMMVAGEVEFRLGGFVLVIAAAFFSGFRWGLTQILLLRNPATSNPFSSVFFLAPVMFLTLLSIAIPVEGPVALYYGFLHLIEIRGAVQAPLILLFPGCIAFFMTVSEFALLQRTSVVTLSIAGICKEVVTIIAAALVFGDTLTPINFVGLITTIGAISAYNWIKITKMRADAQDDVHRLHNAPADAGRSASASPLVASDDDEPAGGGTFRRLSGDLDEPLFTAGGDIVTTLPPISNDDDDNVRKSPPA